MSPDRGKEKQPNDHALQCTLCRSATGLERCYLLQDDGIVIYHAPH